VEDQKISILTSDFSKRDSSNKLVLKPKFEEKVALLKFYPGMDPAVMDWYVERGYKGLIFEGTGLGHIRRHCFESVKNAVKHDLVVAMTSQCIWGRVNMNVYDTGRDLLALGVIPLDDMLPETALVKLMWIFGQTTNLEEAKSLLKINIAGEFSLRTLPEKIGNQSGGKD
jgi:glutamyl-tRNA(Gln) amidotransferase subunit D